MALASNLVACNVLGLNSFLPLFFDTYSEEIRQIQHLF